MEKFLIVLLSVMLVVLLVFNSFGIAYSSNNFVGTILTVEHGLGDFSQFALSSFEKAKEFVLSGADLLDSIYDATIGKLEDKFDFSLLEEISNSVHWMSNTMKQAALIYDFIAERGLNFDEFRSFASAVATPSFYSDFENREGFNWQMCNEYIDFIVHDADNSFSYIKHEATTNALKNRDGKIANTVLVSSGPMAPTSISIDSCKYWFTTEDLQMPDDWLPLLPSFERAMYYFVGLHRVRDTNIYFEEDGITYWLAGFKIRTTTKGLFDPVSFELGGVNFVVDFLFSYDLNEETVQSYWMTAEEFRSRFKSAWLLSLDTFYFVVKDEVLTRDDVYIPE